MKIFMVTASPRITDKQMKEFNKLGNFKVVNASKLSSKEIVGKVADTEILIAGSSGFQGFDREIFEGLKNLKLLTTLTVGMAWVDLETAKEFKVPVCNIKGSNSESVTEHTWGIILDVAKRISEFDRDARLKGAYKFGDYQGKEVYGKTIGIIGLGDSGTKVARIAKGFDMKVIGINRSGKRVKGVELVTLNKLLKESDVISINVPLTDETDGMIGKKEIEKMKDGVVLVNTAREEIVNKDAVVKAVKSGKMHGYGIETDIMQPVKKTDAYLSHPRILVNPHNAFNTEDAERNGFDVTIGNIKAFLKGRFENRVI